MASRMALYDITVPGLIRKLQAEQRLPTTLLLMCLSALCFSLSVFRIVVSHRLDYAFLNWNLFLAGIPWLLSSYVTLHSELRWKNATLAVVLLVWILFIPNAPYILTDLVHLRDIQTMPAWFDLMLILAYAWTGLAFGLVSLHDLEHLLTHRMDRIKADAIVVALLFLSGFGIYLGRYLRWNSWDVVQHPSSLISDIVDRIFNPLSHGRTWGVTLMMGILLNMMYWTVRLVKKNPGN
jgi:uncharacterized membrane protein